MPPNLLVTLYKVNSAIIYRYFQMLMFLFSFHMDVTQTYSLLQMDIEKKKKDSVPPLPTTGHTLT